MHPSEALCCLSLRRFRIERMSDPQRAFSIDQNGVITVAKTLDHEKYNNYLLRVEVNDCRFRVTRTTAVHSLYRSLALAAMNTGIAWIQVNVTDINDNAPNFDPTEIVCDENNPSPRSIFVNITDADSPAFGAPFALTPVDQPPQQFVQYEWSSQGRERHSHRAAQC